MSKDLNEYQAIMNRLDEIDGLLKEKQNGSTDRFMDNQEFLQTMNISQRTAQNWRDGGIIAFSQVGNKIYYRMSDVEKMLDTHYKGTFYVNMKNNITSWK